MNEFLFPIAGILLTTNTALARVPDCSEFFSAIDLQRQCVRMVRTVGEAQGLLLTCSMLKATMEDHVPFGPTSWKDLEACKRIRDVIEPNYPADAFGRS
ncbi:hypothetical protein [Bradyrhizobium sp. WSM2254]|uniref:hypothetical protein n=1 Tax=Bradyrhizobium sp. WSM2254 TaxID=1188263 RepID=UPI0018DCA2BA|nr:hypothetical protein [Bradyrhizobium sp. WSM2254]